MKSVALALTASTLLALACGGGVVTRTDAPPPLPHGVFAVPLTCEPLGVEVFVDDAFAGLCEAYHAGLLPLTVGRHRLEFRRLGHYAEYRTIDVGDVGEPNQFKPIRLLPIPAE